MPGGQLPTGLPSGPRPAATALRWVGGLVVLLVLVGGGTSLVAQFFAQERTETTTITEPVTQLDARTDTGNIRVRAAAPGTPVTVTRVLHWSFREPTTRVDATDGRLVVQADCAGSFFGSCGADLDVLLPPGATMTLTTDTGDVRATASAAVEASTDTGRIDLTVSGSPTVKGSTSTGDVTVTGGAAGSDVQARTDTGRIRLDLTAPPSNVVATSDTGDVSVTVPDGDDYRVDADTDTGTVRVTVPKNDASTRRIEARTDTGDVTVQAR